MNPETILLAIIGFAAAAGAAAVFFKRGGGMQTISLLQANISAYQDAEKLKDQRIAYLEGQLVIKDETIKRLLNDPK